MRTTTLILALTLSMGLASCADQPATSTTTYADAAANQFTAINQSAAARLLTDLQGKISPAQPMIVATVVDINHLEQSSTLGRLISEQVASKFSQSGQQVVEMKFRDNVFIKQDQGELMLTRDVKNIAHAHDAEAVLVGTYAESKNFVYVTLKVIQAQTDVVLAVDNYTLPKDDDVTAMLRNYVRQD